jgi:hypothetical protein
MPAARDTTVGAPPAFGAFAPIFSTLMIRPPAPFHHLRPGQPRQPDGGEQLEVEIGLPYRIGNGREGTGLRGAGIVHQDIDPTQPGHDLAVGARDLFGVGYVAGHGQDATARRRADRLPGCFEHVRPAREQGDIRAAGRHAGRDRQTEALAGTSDHGRTAVQLDIHVRSTLPIGCPRPGRITVPDEVTGNLGSKPAVPQGGIRSEWPRRVEATGVTLPPARAHTAPAAVRHGG